MITITPRMINSTVIGGASEKYSVLMPDVGHCFVKFCSIDEATGKARHQQFGEYIASKFLKYLGVPVHEVELCLASRYNISTQKYGNNEIAVLIKDFTSAVTKLHEFKSRNQSSYDSDMQSKEYTFDDILYLINEHIKSDDEFRRKMREQYCRMFIYDAIIANGDRHSGNWGFIIENNKYKAAPLYDNGAGFFSRLTEYNNIDYEYSVMNAPKSKLGLTGVDKPLRHQNTFKTVMEEMLNRNYFAQIFNAVKSELSLEMVRSAIYKATMHPSIPPDYKDFCRGIAQLRYLCLIENTPLNDAITRVNNYNNTTVRSTDSPGIIQHNNTSPDLKHTAQKEINLYPGSLVSVGLNLSTNIPEASDLHNRKVAGMQCSVQFIRVKSSKSITICNYPSYITIVRPVEMVMR